MSIDTIKDINYLNKKINSTNNNNYKQKLIKQKNLMIRCFVTFNKNRRN